MVFLHIPVENLTKFDELFFFVNIHPSEITECSSCDDKLPQFSKSHEEKKNLPISLFSCTLLQQ